MSHKLLVVVDVQKDFVKGGVLPYGYPSASITQNILDYVKKWNESVDVNFIVATKNTHKENYLSTLEGKNLPYPHCIRNTEWWRFVDETAESGGLEWNVDEVICKPTFGTFRIKEFVEDFERRECDDIDEIQLIGFDLSICVLANAVILRAAFPNKRIVVLKDLCGCVSEDTFNAAVSVLKCQQIEVVDSSSIPEFKGK